MGSYKDYGSDQDLCRWFYASGRLCYNRRGFVLPPFRYNYGSWRFRPTSISAAHYGWSGYVSSSLQRGFFRLAVPPIQSRLVEVSLHLHLGRSFHGWSGYVSSSLQRGFFRSAAGLLRETIRTPRLPFHLARHQLVRNYATILVSLFSTTAPKLHSALHGFHSDIVNLGRVYQWTSYRSSQLGHPGQMVGTLLQSIHYARFQLNRMMKTQASNLSYYGNGQQERRQR